MGDIQGKGIYVTLKSQPCGGKLRSFKSEGRRTSDLVTYIHVTTKSSLKIRK